MRHKRFTNRSCQNEYFQGCRTDQILVQANQWANFFRGKKPVSRKYKGMLNGERYVANTSPYKREVHDLDNENRNCIVDEIIRSRQYKAFSSLDDARREEFSQCPFCCPLVDNSMTELDPQNNPLAGIKSRRVA